MPAPPPSAYCFSKNMGSDSSSQMKRIYINVTNGPSMIREDIPQCTAWALPKCSQQGLYCTFLPEAKIG